MKIAHLYPREMNLYGDTGNVLVLRRRLEWRGLPVEVVAVRQGDRIPDDVDVLVGGGGQDAAQGDIGTDFVARGPQLRELAEAGVVVLAICGTYQLLGHRFLTHDGREIPGVGILDLETVGSSTRLIGNITVDSPTFGRLVGYENHSGLTTLGAAGMEVGADVALRGVLTAAAEQDVGVGGQRVTDAHRHHRHRTSAPLQAPPQDEHVAGVAVDVHLARIQMDQGQRLHDWASPMRSRTACSAHIAV
jgi:CobQ-like glutamine amidotransferase family enzyme